MSYPFTEPPRPHRSSGRVLGVYLMIAVALALFWVGLAATVLWIWRAI